MFIWNLFLSGESQSHWHTVFISSHNSKTTELLLKLHNQRWSNQYNRVINSNSWASTDLFHVTIISLCYHYLISLSLLLSSSLYSFVLIYLLFFFLISFSFSILSISSIPTVNRLYSCNHTSSCNWPGTMFSLPNEAFALRDHQENMHIQDMIMIIGEHQKQKTIFSRRYSLALEIECARFTYFFWSTPLVTYLQWDWFQLAKCCYMEKYLTV